MSAQAATNIDASLDPDAITNKAIRVLFVDDEPSILQSLRRIFRSKRYEVSLANSGKEAIQIMESATFDVIVSDMRMPEMDGATLLAKVAINYPDVSRILLTGYSDIDAIISAVNKGKISFYLSKPCENDKLIDTVENAARLSRLKTERDELLEQNRAQLDELNTLNASLEEKVKQRTLALKKMVDELRTAKSGVEESYIAFAKVFSGLINSRENHKKNERFQETELEVAFHVNFLSSQFKLDEKTSEQLHYAALLRNLGKIILPDTLLHKPYELMDSEEKKQFNRFPALSEALLMSVDSLTEAGNIIRQHRERIDGNGYPDKLKEKDISLPAQILGIVSHYRDLRCGLTIGKQMTYSDTVEYLKKQSGTSFKAELVEPYIKLVSELKDDIITCQETTVRVDQLKPGMILSRDLNLPDGMLLLSREMILNEKLINKIARFEKDADAHFEVFIIQQDAL